MEVNGSVEDIMEEEWNEELEEEEDNHANDDNSEEEEEQSTSSYDESDDYDSEDAAEEENHNDDENISNDDGVEDEVFTGLMESMVVEIRPGSGLRCNIDDIEKNENLRLLEIKLDLKDDDNRKSVEVALDNLLDVISKKKGVKELEFKTAANLLEQKSFASLIRKSRSLETLVLHYREPEWREIDFLNCFRTLCGMLDQNQTIKNLTIHVQNNLTALNTIDLFLSLVGKQKTVESFLLRFDGMVDESHDHLSLSLQKVTGESHARMTMYLAKIMEWEQDDLLKNFISNHNKLHSFCPMCFTSEMDRFELWETVSKNPYIEDVSLFQKGIFLDSFFSFLKATKHLKRLRLAFSLAQSEPVLVSEKEVENLHKALTENTSCQELNLMIFRHTTQTGQTEKETATLEGTCLRLLEERTAKNPILKRLNIDIQINSVSVALALKGCIENIPQLKSLEISRYDEDPMGVDMFGPVVLGIKGSPCLPELHIDCHLDKVATSLFKGMIISASNIRGLVIGKNAGFAFQRWDELFSDILPLTTCLRSLTIENSKHRRIDCGDAFRDNLSLEQIIFDKNIRLEKKKIWDCYIPRNIAIKQILKVPMDNPAAKLPRFFQKIAYLPCGHSFVFKLLIMYSECVGAKFTKKRRRESVNSNATHLREGSRKK